MSECIYSIKRRASYLTIRDTLLWFHLEDARLQQLHMQMVKHDWGFNLADYTASATLNTQVLHFKMLDMFQIYTTHTHARTVLLSVLIDSSPLSRIGSLICRYVTLAWLYAGNFLWEYDCNCPELCAKPNFQVSLLESNLRSRSFFCHLSWCWC